MADLLIELFSEEIPARMQAGAARDLARLMTDALKGAGLTFDAVETATTPRRLALNITGLPVKTPDIREERKGPNTSAPEKAMEGFLRSVGLNRDQCDVREIKGKEFLFAVIEKPGRATAEVVSEALEATIRNFPWPKSQRWGSGTLRWVRPLRNILCLFDGSIVDVTVDGHTANDKTFGHRFMAPAWFSVTDFADYKEKLRAHNVIVSPAERMDAIEKAVRSLCADKGLEWIEDKGLLAEVAGLVEWPVPLIGDFDPAFLEVPEEVLILTMKKDQKYFTLRDPKSGKLAPHFITISNIEAADGGKIVAAGNAKVITARLADAKFFWEQDLKKRLEDNLPALEDIVFHIKLGKVSDRVARMKRLAGELSQYIDGCDRAEAERAAELAKADLVSSMVYEFPEVQGVMGRYYALEQGENAAVADAVRDHYAPAGPNDDCPSAPVSIAVALAEKIDTLVGFFGVDEKPTGSKDPYALRRAALGIIRLITENGVRVSLVEILSKSVDGYLQNFVNDLKFYEKLGQTLKELGIDFSEFFVRLDELSKSENILELLMGPADANLIEKLGLQSLSDLFDEEDQKIEFPNSLTSVLSFLNHHLIPDLLSFFGDRLKVQQKDKGVRHDLIDAVFAKGDDDLVRILARVSALGSFLDSDDGANLLAGYKRAANILKKADVSEFPAPTAGAADADKALFDAVSAMGSAVDEALASEDYEKAMALLASLRAPIDRFFDEVMVNDEDAAVRLNRLSLLNTICNAVNGVADFSRIEG